MSFLLGMAGNVLRTLGGGILGSLVKPAFNAVTGIAGKVLRPLTSVLKPIGNTISKWMGADFMEE